MVGLVALESAMTESVYTILDEIKLISVRSYDKCVQLLAQSVSKYAMNAAVAGATRVAQTAVATTNIPLSARTVHADYNSYTPPVSTILSPRPKSREVAGFTALSPRGGAGAVPAADRKRLARGNSGLSVSSVATTPPAQYTVPLSAQPSVNTPRETVIEIPISPKPKTVASQSPREGDGGVDAEKMQLGLQGIKSMRARSASSSVRRAGDPTASAGADSTGVPSSSNSRAGSACRSRRRILNNGSTPADCASPAPNSPTHLLGGSQPAVFTTTAVDVLTPRRSARNNIVSPRGTSAAGAVLTCPSSPGSRLNNSNKSSSSNNPPLSPKPAQGLPIAARIAQELSGVWYEAKLLLRQVPHSDNDWKKMQQVAKLTRDAIDYMAL